MTDTSIVYLVLAGTIAFMMGNRFSAGLVAITAALALAFTGVIDFVSVGVGFGDPVVIMIASLFVVSEALDRTGITAWVGARVEQLGQGKSGRTLVVVMILVALLTSLISVNGAVAALVPMTVLVAMRVSEPSQMLLPLAFAAHAGSMLTLTGTPVNILVADQLEAISDDRFAFFSFALVGVPLLVGTILIIMLLGPKVLPRGRAATRLTDLSTHQDTLADQYLSDGPLVEVDERGSALPTDPSELISIDQGVAEIIIPPRSSLVGKTVFPGMVTDSGRFVVLAVQRSGEDIICDGKTAELAVGDAMLLRGSWKALETELVRDDDVLVVDNPAAVRRQVVPLGQGSGRTLIVLFFMIVFLVLGVVPAAIVTLVAACALVAMQVLDVEQVYSGISWPTVTVIAGMIPVSAAVTSSGAAAQVGDLLVEVAEPFGPHALLLGVFVCIAVLGQLISNTATALIVIPIAVAAAADMGVDPAPVLMCVTVAAAGAFLTPVATPANMMVQHPGGYRFGDYWRLGLPLLIWFGCIAVLLVPMIWRF